MKDLIKRFLRTVCGFTAEATKEITKNQANDNLDKFYLLNNKKFDTLYSIVRKSHALANRAKSGHAISNLAQECLKLAIFAMKHYKPMSCKIDLETMTKKDIIAIFQKCQMELSLKLIGQVLFQERVGGSFVIGCVCRGRDNCNGHDVFLGVCCFCFLGLQALFFRFLFCHLLFILVLS
jgi:hypothetical protein